jgi:hypothetical protein
VCYKTEPVARAELREDLVDVRRVDLCQRAGLM